MAAEGINLCEALEWYEFFTKNDLDVFDVLHGAISVAVLYWPDDFMTKTDHIAQFLNAKKPFEYKNKNNGPGSGSGSGSDHLDDDIKFSDHNIITTDQAAENPEETKAKSPISSLSTKSEPKKSPASLPCEEALPTKKKMSTTKKIGLGRRIIKKEKQNHELLEDSSKDHHHHHHVHISDTIIALSATTTANKGTPGGGDVSSTLLEAADKQGKTVLSSSTAAKGTSRLKRDDSAATKLQKTNDLHDEAALERKLESSKRKLHDGYKSFEAAKKRIRLIDAPDIPKQQRSIVPAVTRIRVN